MRSQLTPARASLAGLTVGFAFGVLLASAERSPLLHVYADPLSAAFRVLIPRLSESSWTRLDTDATAAAFFIAPFSILGAVMGVLGRRVRPHLAFLCVCFLAAGSALLFPVWGHRQLDPLVGFGLMAAVTAGAGVYGWIVMAMFDRLLSRQVRIALAFSLAVVLGISATAVGISWKGPRAPKSRLVSAGIREPTQQKVAILALDGLDGFLVDEARREGRLPNLGRLIDRGIRGDLRSIRPPRSPVVWTSVVTGMLPGTHGIRDFVVRRDGQRIPVSGAMRKVPALWDLGRETGFTTAFVNWYVSWPADSVRGIQITDRADFSGLEARVVPASRTATIDSIRAALDARGERDLVRFFGEQPDSSELQVLWGQERRSMQILRDVIRHDLFTFECAKEALRGGQLELTALYFRGADNTQHLFWKDRLAARKGERIARMFANEIDPARTRKYAPVIDHYYDFLDELVGEIVAMLEPDTAFLILSDHGFLTNNERGRWIHMNRILESLGWARLIPGTGGAADSAASIVWDVGAPSIDRVRTLRPGLRAPNAEALEQAKQTLSSARTDRGDPLVLRCESGDDASGPFLRVTISPKVRGRTLTIGSASIPLSQVIAPEGHSGDHRMNGMLIAAGPPFPPGERITGARAVDIAPTVIHLLGVPVALDMEGVVLEKLFTQEWWDSHPLRSVDSYGKREATEKVSPTPADERIREELRALGYIQ